MRLPFKFGDTTVTETAEAVAAVTIEIGRARITGHSAQLMIPRWFDKRRYLSNADTVDELRQTPRQAGAAALDATGTVSTISTMLREQVVVRMPAATPRLAAGFGPALVEMALIDAVCKSARCNFFTAARHDLFGLRQHTSLDLDLATLLQVLGTISPRWSINLRHTVGTDAALTAAEIGEDPNDGAPVALRDVITTHSLQAFKIKLCGKIDKDIQRLCNIASVLALLPQYRVSLDANEQYDPDDFQDFMRTFACNPTLARLYTATMFVEQPFARDIALSIEPVMLDVGLPLIIDESDDDDDDVFRQAMQQGWNGISVKSCKGVLRALLNFCRVHNQCARGNALFLTGKDLTCQPGICLQQDTLMSTAVGVDYIERNGAHFGGGLQGANAVESQTFVSRHPDLYRLENGRLRLLIRDGVISFGSLDCVGYGVLITSDTQKRLCYLCSIIQVSQARMGPSFHRKSR